MSIFANVMTDYLEMLMPNYTWCNHCNARLRDCPLPLPLCALQNERDKYVQVQWKFDKMQ